MGVLNCTVAVLDLEMRVSVWRFCVNVKFLPRPGSGDENFVKNILKYPYTRWMLASSRGLLAVDRGLFGVALIGRNGGRRRGSFGA